MFLASDPKMTCQMWVHSQPLPPVVSFGKKLHLLCLVLVAFRKRMCKSVELAISFWHYQVKINCYRLTCKFQRSWDRNWKHLSVCLSSSPTRKRPQSVIRMVWWGYLSSVMTCTSSAFPTFQVLDVSYNNLSQEDILTIGLLPNLKVLHLTGNALRTLPQNMGMPHVDPKRYSQGSP